MAKSESKKVWHKMSSVRDLKSIGSEFIDSFLKHDLMTLAAALAFYTALSLAPLLVIILSIVGVLGDASKAQLLEQVRGLIGPEAGKAIAALVQSAEKRPDIGSLAGIIGIFILVFSASTVFAQLQSSLNVIWSSKAEAAENGVWIWVRKRLFSMGIVISFGFLALVSLFVSSAMTFVFNGEGAIWGVLNFVATFAVFSGIFAAILKYLPDARPSWRAAGFGGVVIALLFTAGKSLIGLYLGRSAVGSSYGAAGSLIVLLAWVYYSSVIIFAGAELTRVLTDDQSPAA